jgi:hypothetical protein
MTLAAQSSLEFLNIASAGVMAWHQHEMLRLERERLASQLRYEQISMGLHLLVNAVDAFRSRY